MVFDYYRKLSRTDRHIYNESDRINGIRLPTDHGLGPVVQHMEQALRNEDQRAVAQSTSDLCQGVCELLSTTPVRVKVLAQRPSDDWGELYGLYEGREGRRRALISLWMRTAQKGKAVAFKTYIRTAFHELCHHLDYEYLQLEDSFHTQGFYRRESSLFKQLVPVNDTAQATQSLKPSSKLSSKRATKSTVKPHASTAVSLPVQQELF